MLWFKKKSKKTDQFLDSLQDEIQMATSLNKTHITLPLTSQERLAAALYCQTHNLTLSVDYTDGEHTYYRITGWN